MNHYEYLNLPQFQLHHSVCQLHLLLLHCMVPVQFSVDLLLPCSLQSAPRSTTIIERVSVRQCELKKEGLYRHCLQQTLPGHPFPPSFCCCPARLI